MSAPLHDRNLLLLATALENRFLSAEGLEGALRLWKQAPDKSFKDVLVADSFLTSSQYALCEGMADEQFKQRLADLGPTITLPLNSTMRYHALRPHKKGGMGEVWIARD